MFNYNEKNEMIPDPVLMLVPEFKKIWDRDKTKSKEKAKREFAYIYFIADYKSEYNTFGLEKEESIAIDIMKDKEYIPDDVVIEAIEKYEKLQLTSSMRYLKSIRMTVDSLIAYLENLKYNPDKKEEYKPTEITKSLKDIEVILEKLEKWEKKVFEEEEDMIIRGGGKAGMFEDKEKATWLNKS